MAEEFAFDEFRGDGGAVHFHVRHHGSLRELVQAAGDEFLAGAVGAGDEDAGVGGGDLVDHVADVPHALGLAHHLLPIDLLLEDLGLGDEVRLVGRVLDGDEDAVQVQGLADEVERALLDAVHGRVDVGVAGDHDDRGLDPVGDELLKDFGTVHPGHLDVAEDGVVLLLFRHFTGVGAVFGRVHLVIFHLQDLLEGVADGAFVVNNQNLHTLETFMQIYGLFYYICKTDP